jgi:hypothetical protein
MKALWQRSFPGNQTGDYFPGSFSTRQRKRFTYHPGFTDAAQAADETITSHF